MSGDVFSDLDLVALVTVIKVCSLSGLFGVSFGGIVHISLDLVEDHWQPGMGRLKFCEM